MRGGSWFRRRRRQWFPWRLWTWWNARLDARHNVPADDTEALGETEQQIVNAVNLAISDAEKVYCSKADRPEARLSDYRRREQEVKHEYERLSKEAGRKEPLVHLGYVSHCTLMALLVAGEAVFNAEAFNVFGEATLYTLLMASSVAVALPICAHVLGVWLRQWPPPWWKTAAKFVSVTVMLAGILWWLNMTRFAYLEEVDPVFARAHPELDKAFLAINVLVLLAAMLVTYLSEDPTEGFAEAKRKWDRLNAAISRTEGKLDEWANTLEAEITAVTETGRALIAYYRKINRRHRDNKVPKYFNDKGSDYHQPKFKDHRQIAQYHVSGRDARTDYGEVSNTGATGSAP